MALQLGRPPTDEPVAGDAIVVHFTGCRVWLDEGTLHRIRDQLLALAEEPSEAPLLLDFGNVEYVASAALGTLVSLQKKLRARGRRLAVGNVRPQVQEVFAITRLDRYFELGPAQSEGRPRAEDGPPSFPPGVLVVADEAAVPCALVAGLPIEGYKVWVASHGKQAVDIYRRHREGIAVVLLDVLLPGMDGPRTLTALQQLCPGVRCCFMTGSPTPYTPEGLLRMGAARVLRKPVAFTEVIETVNQLAGRSPGRRQDRWIELPGKECKRCWC
jgi:anti-sigma B factor antagonist